MHLCAIMTFLRNNHTHTINIPKRDTQTNKKTDIFQLISISSSSHFIDMALIQEREEEEEEPTY